MKRPTTYLPSITNMIRFDHSHVLALFRRYKPSTSLTRKRAILTSACLALEIHAQLEEEIFYPALRAAIGSDPTLDKSTPEHDVMRQLIEVVRGLEPGSEKCDEAFQELMRAVLHHVADEETVLLPRAEKLLAADLGALGYEMTRRRLQLLGPHTPEALQTTAYAFPIVTALFALAVSMLGVRLIFGGRTDSHRALTRQG